MQIQDDSLPISPEEIGGVTGISIGFLVFQYFYVALALGISLFLIVKFSHEYIFKERNHKRNLKYGKRIWFLLIIFFLIDTYLTYYAVIYLKVAEEINPFVNYLWNNLGFTFGEVIRCSILTITFLGINYQLNSQNYKRRAVAYFLSIFLALLWLLVILSNINQLFQFFLY